MTRKRRREPEPLDLVFMLADSIMHLLSPNAWKVVSYVAAQQLRVYSELLERLRDPAVFFLAQDLKKGGGIIEPSGESDERPYRPVSGGPTIPGEQASRFVMISLRELCIGKRIKRRWRDRGTGLSKSSVTEAIKEAIDAGILVRERQRTATGRDVSSAFAIDWDRVQQYDWERRKGLNQVSTSRTPD
jgi:hypothetical protein